ncbi:MAG TPA: exodeoxyribonuclease III [Vicinamibacteria bacterium]|nr:exodeoxyribonuclease III [Vicinamibacteria bacterium]
MIRIASWNVNSIRLRARWVAHFLRKYQPDVLCIQETKVPDELFPRERFEKLGYVHQALWGQKSYNGVAILSRIPLHDVVRRRWCHRHDRRHVQATLPGGVEIHNLYVPAGGPLPDPERNPKFEHKLRFLRNVTRWFRRRRGERPSILVGDLNVAPLPTDVWSHEKLRRVVTHTPVEVAAWKRLARDGGFVDAVRELVPAQNKVFTWWSYRTAEWKKANKGRRLDHVLVSDSLRERLVSARVIAKARGWHLPSDHVPVIVELSVVR